MSEIEINEDNCVLDGYTIDNLDDIFETYLNYCEPKNKSMMRKYILKLFLKINKLNDMAKEKKETEKIGLLGKDADAIVFSEYSIDNEFKEKRK